MSELEKRNIVSAIDSMSDEQKLMTLGFVKGLAAANTANGAKSDDQKKDN